MRGTGPGVLAAGALDRSLVSFSGVDITLAGLVAAVLALVGARLVSLLARRAINRYVAHREHASRASLYTLSRTVHYTVLVLGALLAASLLGVPLDRFAVFAGALGVGLGFGLQTIFSNFVSGLILLFDKSLKVGDFVELESGVHGEVRDIKIRATSVVTNDNIDILVPNSEFSESALEFELVTWLNAEATKKPGAVRAAYNWELHSALQRHSIEIPFPQRDVNVRSLFGHTGATALRTLGLEVPGPSAPPRPGQRDPGLNDAVDDVRSTADQFDPGSPEPGGQ